MSSKRHIRRKQCEGKVQHPGKEGAETARRALRQSFPAERFDVYKCRYCRHWHVGHRMHRG